MDPKKYKIEQDEKDKENALRLQGLQRALERLQEGPSLDQPTLRDGSVLRKKKEEDETNKGFMKKFMGSD